MRDPIRRLLSADHERLDALLERALADPERLDADAFHAFREGLLRHIGIEEKLLFPAAARARGSALTEAARLRADHSVFATLLVPHPRRAFVEELRRRLVAHNLLEEGEAGVYAAVDQLLTADELSDLADRVREFPQPPVAPYSDNPRVLAKIREFLDG